MVELGVWADVSHLHDSLLMVTPCRTQLFPFLYCPGYRLAGGKRELYHRVEKQFFSNAGNNTGCLDLGHR